MRVRLIVIGTVLAAVLVAIPSALTPRAAEAHPLGNFTVNRYSRLELTPGVVRIRYVVDMAEIPAFQERTALDADRNGRIDDAETGAYAARQAGVLGENLRLTVNGRAVGLRATEREVTLPPGQGGLDTLRFAGWFEGVIPTLSGAVSVDYRDDNYADRLGWKEVVVRGGPGIDVIGSSAPETDISDELRRYPDDLLQSPPDQRSARLSIAPGEGKALPRALGSETDSRPRARDRFSELITREQSLPVLLLSLVIAMGLGGLHALGPGHGKTVVAAYLVGSRGTTKHAAFLGLTVTVTHTSSVFLLGVVALYLSEFILPEQLFPWLSFASGASIAALGLALLVSRTRALLAARRGDRSGLREILAVAPIPTQGFSGPSARSRMRHYAPEAAHTHDHGARAHGHGPFGTHSHGGKPHSHLPPGATGERVTWRGLLALGISGGLLPCPSALVVLLTAITIGRIAYGMLLIVAFSLGLAAVLTGIGLLLVHARVLFSRLPLDGTLGRALPVASAVIVMVLGVAIAYNALAGGNSLGV